MKAEGAASPERRVGAWCDAARLWVALSDGRVIGTPLAWFPRLARAGEAQRAGVTFSTRGLHWEALDEDVLVAGLLEGRADRSVSGATA